MTNETYEKLINFLDENGAEYRLIDHELEGRTEIVSEMRGHDVAAAAKCIILMVKVTKKKKKFVLAVVPGDAKVDMNVIKALYNGVYVSFANQEIAEELAGCVSGTVLPFAFNEELDLIVDPGVLGHEEIFFNAARLDRSLALKGEDYKKLAEPRVKNIAKY